MLLLILSSTENHHSRVKPLYFDWVFQCASPTSDTTRPAKADTKDFWVNMPNLISHLKKVAEQKPQATYYNVDMLKYQVTWDFESSFSPTYCPFSL